MGGRPSALTRIRTKEAGPTPDSVGSTELEFG